MDGELRRRYSMARGRQALGIFLKPLRPELAAAVGPQVICTKVRDGDKRIVRLKEGEPRGRHVVIVDDLVQSGSTLIECQKLLSSQVRHDSAPRAPSTCRPYISLRVYVVWLLSKVIRGIHGTLHSLHMYCVASSLLDRAG